MKGVYYNKLFHDRIKAKIESTGEGYEIRTIVVKRIACIGWLPCSLTR